MEQEIKLLIINPGSTSTRISIFENGVERYKKSLSHPASEVARYARAADQAPFRQKAVEEFLAEIDYDLSGLTAIVARGGSLPPIHTGAYVVNDEMIDVLQTGPSDNMPPPPLRLSHWIWPNGSIFRPTSMTAIPLTRWSRFPGFPAAPWCRG